MSFVPGRCTGQNATFSGLVRLMLEGAVEVGKQFCSSVSVPQAFHEQVPVDPLVLPSVVPHLLPAVPLLVRQPNVHADGDVVSEAFGFNFLESGRSSSKRFAFADCFEGA